MVVSAAAFGGGVTDRSNTHRVAIFTLGKPFNAGELATVIDPALAPFGLKRVPEKDQDRAIPYSETWWYGSLGYAPGTASLYYDGGNAPLVLIFADRSMHCVRISISGRTHAPDERIVPTFKAIVTALSKQYGSDLKPYSDLQCLHAL